MTAASPPAPVVTVTRGQATPAELAAVLAVLLAAAAARPAGPAPAPEKRSAWAGSARTRVALPPPGYRSWRSSVLPS